STAIRDVVNPYGDKDLVKIAHDHQGFVRAIEELLAMDKNTWLPRVDRFLNQNSWDITQEKMFELIKTTIKNKETLAA
ncbi:MAG TPA: glycosyltransferase family 1 protein, partial [Sphingobacteriaceae bacterium]